MSGQCNICLGEFKEPCSLPCGHVYCSDCIWDHVGTSTEDVYTASCPTCRSSFPIALPDLRCLPKKFHPFITPSVRRLFIETSTDTEALSARLDTIESRNAVLEKDNKQLMSACEKYMRRCEAHTLGEREATIGLKRFQGQYEAERKKTDELQAQLDALKDKYERLKQVLRDDSEHTRASAPSPPARIGVKRLRLSRSDSSSSGPTVDAVHDESSRRRVLRGLPIRARSSVDKPSWPRAPAAQRWPHRRGPMRPEESSEESSSSSSEEEQ